jgi:hypothetical protein
VCSVRSIRGWPPKQFDDPDYLKRRHELSLIPGSW